MPMEGVFACWVSMTGTCPEQETDDSGFGELFEMRGAVREEVFGAIVVRETAKVRSRIGVVLGGDRGLYPRLSARHNLEILGRALPCPPGTIEAGASPHFSSRCQRVALASARRGTASSSIARADRVPANARLFEICGLASAGFVEPGPPYLVGALVFG